MWSAVGAFAFITVCFAIGDIIAIKTKGYLSSLFFTIVVFLILGAVLRILPTDLVEISGLNSIQKTYGMAFLFVNIGSNLKFRELVAEWKTILVSLGAVAGIIIMGFTVGQLFCGKEYALSSIGTICGGLGATVVTADIANNAGRPDIASFVTAVLTFQSFIGIPIASVCLAKASRRFIADGGMQRESRHTEKKLRLPVCPAMPGWVLGKNMYLAKLAVVGFIGELVARLTGFNSIVCYILMGFLFAEVGVLDRGSLEKSGSDGLILIGSYAFMLTNFLALSLKELVQMTFPIVSLLILGAAAVVLFSMIMGKILHWDRWLAIAVGIACMVGYPATYALSMEAINSNTLGKDYNPEEIRRLTNYILPRMVIGGTISVSIASVIIAASVGPMIFT